MERNYKKILPLFVLMASFLLVACEKKSIVKTPSMESVIEEEDASTAVLPNISRSTYASSGSQLDTKLFAFSDLEDLASKSIQDNEFVYNWSMLAHMMGFGWCGGTRSQYVGQDFDFKKTWKNGQVAYELQAHYNSRDPYANGYRANDRLKITIENVRFVIDPKSIDFEEPRVTQLEPLVAASYTAVNPWDREDNIGHSFVYRADKTYNKTDTYSFSEKIGVKTSFKVGVPCIADGKVETSFEFTANQGWSTANGNTLSKTLTNSYNCVVPAHSQRRMDLISLQRKTEVPYSSNIYMLYDVTLSGFMRWGWNGMNGFPRNRPYVNIKFGGNNGQSAQDYLADIYKRRDISGYSDWDWGRIFEKYGQSPVDWLVNKTVNRQFGGVQTGVFTEMDGTETKIIAHIPEPITNDNTGLSLSRSKRSIGENGGILIKDVKVYDVDNIELIEIDKNN